MEKAKDQTIKTTIAGAIELFFYDAKPTEEEAKIMKDIVDETDRELEQLCHKYDPDCINNAFGHYCKDPKGSPCEK